MRWVTQQRPKIDRLACPWLISRFIDPNPEFLFVPARDVTRAAVSAGAIPFDVPRGAPGVEFSHPDGGCTFDVFRARFHLDDPALARVAAIVRAADNDNLLRAIPEAAGLRAISLGLARHFRDDHERLAFGLVLYDVLYDWARKAPRQETVDISWAAATFGTWMGRARQRRALAGLNAHQLRDIGLAPDDARLEASKPFWRN
jgi:hypothetical protein